MYLQQRRGTGDSLSIGSPTPRPDEGGSRKSSSPPSPHGRHRPPRSLKGSLSASPATPAPSHTPQGVTYMVPTSDIRGSSPAHPRFGSKFVKFHHQIHKQRNDYYYDDDKVKAAIDNNGLQLAVKMQRTSARTLAPIDRSPQVNGPAKSKPGAVKTIEDFVKHELGLLREDGDPEVPDLSGTFRSTASSAGHATPKVGPTDTLGGTASAAPADASAGDNLSHRYQRLNIFRQAFHMFLSVVPAYSPILDLILTEYESFIRLLEGRMRTPGKERQEVYQQFEAELAIRQTHMDQRIAAKEEEFVQKQAQLKVREEEVEGELANIVAENHHLQQEITRLHEQNLTLSHNIVDYRFQTQRVEQQMKECEQLERKYERLHREHQSLLEQLVNEGRENPNADNIAARVAVKYSPRKSVAGSSPAPTPLPAPRQRPSDAHTTPVISAQPTPEAPPGAVT